MEKKEEKTVSTSELTEREKIELRKEAYRLSLNIQMPDEYKSRAEWLDFKSREIYKWLLLGED